MASYTYTGLFLCFLLWIFSPAAGKEFTITCLTSEECVLPCQFQSDGKGARIMWYKKEAVVSCTRYGNTSFLISHVSPADEYKGRTGLYADQVLKGNATLLLRNVTPRDQGKYFCVTRTASSTNESGIISLVVRAPVREVGVEFSGDSVICRAEGIYPAPTLTWSTHPPSDPRLLQNKTKSQKTHHDLYNIESSLLLTENIINQTYICCVSSDTNRKTTFLKHEASIRASPGGDVMVPCSLPLSVLQSFNLTWRFGRSDPILSIRVIDQKSQVKVWDQWKLHVSNGLSVSSSLKLHGLKSKHQGTFTCEVRTPEETYVTPTDIIVTEECEQYVYISIIIGLSFLLCLSALVFLGFRIRRSGRDKGREERRDGSAEGLIVKVNAADR